MLVLGCWLLVGTVGTDASVDPNVFELEILYSPSLGILRVFPCWLPPIEKNICFFATKKGQVVSCERKGEISVETGLKHLKIHLFRDASSSSQDAIVENEAEFIGIPLRTKYAFFPRW